MSDTIDHTRELSVSTVNSSTESGYTISKLLLVIREVRGEESSVGGPSRVGRQRGVARVVSIEGSSGLTTKIARLRPPSVVGNAERPKRFMPQLLGRLKSRQIFLEFNPMSRNLSVKPPSRTDVTPQNSNVKKSLLNTKSITGDLRTDLIASVVSTLPLGRRS